MKILMLNYEFPPLGGGAGNANLHILKELRKNNNVQIDLVTSAVSTFRVDKFSDNITIHYLDIGKRGNLLHQSNKDLLSYSYKAYFYCRKLIKKQRFDFIHSFFGIPCGFIAYKLKLPYLISLRGSDVPGHNPAFQKIHKWLYSINRKTWSNAKKIIANSEDLKRTALQTGFKKEIGVIPNGVDCNLFKPIENKKRESKLNVLFVGRLNKVKNIDVLIKTISQLEDVILNVVGDGPEKENLKALVRTLGSDTKVHFLDRKSHGELNAIYNQNDVFALLSGGEGGSNVVLEAMSCGLAILITNTGGADTLVKENGFVVNDLSGDELRNKISYLIQHREEVVKMGNTSRKIAETLSWENTAKQYEKVYDEMMN